MEREAHGKRNFPRNPEMSYRWETWVEFRGMNRNSQEIKQEIIDISGTGHQMEPWKKLVLHRTEEFGKNTQKSQRRWEISESIF